MNDIVINTVNQIVINNNGDMINSILLIKLFVDTYVKPTYITNKLLHLEEIMYTHEIYAKSTNLPRKISKPLNIQIFNK